MSAPEMKDRIRKYGQISNVSYAAFSSTRSIRPIAVTTKIAKAKLKADTVTVGTAPAGYGQSIAWDRVDESMLVVAFLNAADPLGIAIAGLEPGDWIQVLDVSGIASFSEDKGNPIAASIAGILATGAKIATTAFGAPELIPLISAGEDFAKKQFAPSGLKTERRDGYGVDPANGLKARQEGGFLVSMPAAGGPAYSGDDDHKDRWIAKPGDRTDANMPKHITNSFFPIRGNPAHNGRRTFVGGEAYLTCWDWNFEDNAGFYRVMLHVWKQAVSADPGREG